MTSINKKIQVIIYLSFVFLLSTYLYLDNSEYFSDIITFLSVTLGFSITAMSIIATSKFSKELYNKESPYNNSKTLLHILIDRFKKSIIIFLITLSSILLFFYVKKMDFIVYDFWKTEISVKSIMIGNIWYLTILSIYHFVNVLNLFSKFIIQSSKKM